MVALAFAFGKERRLRSRRDILSVQQRGARVHTPHFVLIVAKGTLPALAPRLGVTVTRKVGDSVRRNRVKRLVRETFRLDPSWLPHGVDLLVIAKGGAPLLGLAAVQAEWGAVRGLLARRAREALLALTPAKGR